MSRIALERIKDHGGMYDLVSLVLFGNRGEEENGSQESCSLSTGDSCSSPENFALGREGADEQSPDPLPTCPHC